ncbi:MAG: type II CAAX endopeptidase family protein [Ilumatobacteraceae bacterium]
MSLPTAGRAPWPPPTWPPPAPSVPPTAAEPREPHPTLSWRAGLLVLVVTAAALVGSRQVVLALADVELPALAYFALAAGLGYGPMVAAAFWVSRRHGLGRLSDDLGWRFRPLDLVWGPVVWLSSYIGTVSAALLITAFDVPFTSNADGLQDLEGHRGAVVGLVLTAVVVAPIVEELVFRGVLLRAFASRLPAWAAVAAQAVCFGLAHFDPSRGRGNVGLLLVLTTVGAVFGAAAWIFRRIAPTVIAHALLNGVAMLALFLLD